MTTVLTMDQADRAAPVVMKEDFPLVITSWKVQREWQRLCVCTSTKPDALPTSKLQSICFSAHTCRYPAEAAI